MQREATQPQIGHNFLVRLHDLTAVNDFPPVIAGADIAAFRKKPDSPAARDFLSGYLGFDSRSQHALHTTLSSLAQPRSGGAFWFNGVFGSGKSHLLGILTLLSEGSGHAVFQASHPDCAGYLQGFQLRLAVHISLDEFDASRLGLEEIFWREVAREWESRGFGPLGIERSGARVEAFAALDAALGERGLAGLVVCLDELSLYLGGREHNPLQGDAAFLQFLGAQTRRAPIWLFVALQKTIDDISGLERYSLGQIRDRFTLLPLSLANMPALVEKRLVRIKDEKAVEAMCAETWAELERCHPRLDFGPAEWRSTFPFHPATLSLLEAVTGRFFSRTRSAAIFCARAIDPQKDATWRVPPDAIWDYFLPELEAHPDLRPLENVWRGWEDTADHIFAPADRDNGRRVMKWILLCKIAGQLPTPIQLGNAFDFGLQLEGDGIYEYARFLLERLRSRGSFLAVERGETPLHDRYTVDLGKRIGEMARRHLSTALETVPVGDPRIGAHIIQCCASEPLPLAGLSEPKSVTLFWQSAPRRLSVEVWDGSAPSLLANRAGQTREPGHPEDSVLAICPPFGEEVDVTAVISLLEPQSRAALWFWKPREPARDEWELAREATAAGIAAHDPALADNRRGRAILEHLQKEAPSRDAQVARIALRLLLEGELVLGNGAVLEASELASGENFGALLEAVGDFAWPQLFPRFVDVAPRARLLTPSNADSLCLEILRRPVAEPFFAASLERLARQIGEPLGVAKSSSGRWKIVTGKADLNAQILTFLGEGAPYSALEAHLAKSEWGLRSEQTATLVCALLRGGEIAAFDSQGAEQPPYKIGLPLRRSVHYLRPGRLPSGEEWTRIAVLLKELCGFNLGAISFAEAQRAAVALMEWREDAATSADLAGARGAQLRRALGQPNAAWPRFEAAGGAMTTVLQAVPEQGAAYEVLSRVAQLDYAAQRENLGLFRQFAVALETRNAVYLAAHTLVTHSEFMATPDISFERAALLEHLHGGEEILFDAGLAGQCAVFINGYNEKYAQWHGAQNDQARWNGWRRLAQSDGVRALDRLSTLHNRSFGGEIRAQIETELQKRCPRDGALGPGEPVCTSCGLRLGERFAVRDKSEIEGAVERELTALSRAVQENGTLEFLMRRESPLAQWDGEDETLLPLLSGANLRTLDEAFAPRRRVTRSREKLTESLARCRTRGEMESAFWEWIDGGELLGTDDEIELSP